MSKMTGNLYAGIVQKYTSRPCSRGGNTEKINFPSLFNNFAESLPSAEPGSTVDCNHWFSGFNDLLFPSLQLRFSWSIPTLVLYLSLVRNTQTTSSHLR